MSSGRIPRSIGQATRPSQASVFLAQPRGIERAMATYTTARSIHMQGPVPLSRNLARPLFYARVTQRPSHTQ
jgi:hypothetical protein